MYRTVKKFSSPMISLLLLSIGATILTTGQAVWLHEHHYSSLFVGIVTASYYLGFVYAAFRTEKLIVRVSHIRAYASFAALLCSAIILQGIFPNPWYWIGLRLLAGYCTAGLFVVIESWLLCKSTNYVRGQVLALYMIFYYAAQALGQFFLNVGVDDILRLFAIAGIFSSLSIIPLAVTKVAQPQIEEPSALSVFKLFKLSPSGVSGSFVSGLILGPIYGLFPLYLAAMYKNNSITALSMFILIAGGMFFQMPFGKLSDYIPRRKIIAAAFVLLLISAIAILTFTQATTMKYVFLFIFGGAAFTIYPLSMSHACDVLDVKDMVSAAQGLVLINSIGLVIGPIVASSFINLFTARFGLISYFIIISLIMTAYFIWRQIVGTEIEIDEQQDFIAVPRSTPVAIEMDPRTD